MKGGEGVEEEGGELGRDTGSCSFLSGRKGIGDNLQSIHTHKMERQPGEGDWEAEGELWSRNFRAGQVGSCEVTPGKRVYKMRGCEVTPG